MNSFVSVSNKKKKKVRSHVNGLLLCTKGDNKDDGLHLHFLAQISREIK